MPPSEPPKSNDVHSALWLWGFWILAAAAAASFILSLYTSYPLDRAFRVISGVLFIVGGLHNGRVVAYKRATRGPYSIFGPYALLNQRQTGWSAIVLGLVFIASAIVGL